MFPLFYLTITGGDLTSIFGEIGVVFDGIKPLLLVVIGVMLGFWILQAIINIASGHLERGRETRAEIEGIERAEEKRIFKPYHEHRKGLIRKRVREKLHEEA